MTQTQHTPGPYMATEDENCGGGSNINLVDHPTIRIGHTAAVNSPIMLKGHAPISAEEAQATACLFAAAPRLLAELKAFVNRWGKYPKKPTGADLQIYLDNARAAIAEAEG